MQLEDLFEKDVDRTIEGVIKADDDTMLRLELDEYVITNEVEQRLEKFLTAYNRYENANGVWVSGFFGSGKSHLLKMLAMLMENRQVDDTCALDFFLEKCEHNEILRGDLRKAVAIPSESILFNIDQKADVISKTEIDALIAVFVKVFDEHCGYYGKQGYIAQFERELDRDGLFDSFKAEFKKGTEKEWEWARSRAKRMSADIDKAYQAATGQSSKDILDKYRSDYRLSIDDFAEQVKAYIDKQAPEFRLNFFVDECGQYVADNVKLMTNLQTVAESLATKCQGRSWIVVTAQEDMSSVLGEIGKKNSNDFTKIQARFSNRMKLTSQNVDEVIQRRLLKKKETYIAPLTDLYEEQKNNFKTLFDFSDGGQTYRNYRDREHFIHCYPFVPYQFELFQSAIQNLSTHGAFEGQHSSVGERSMLGVFQQVAIHIKGGELGDLATFDLMFSGISTALKTAIQQSVLNAENRLTNLFAIRLLKALFLIKYVKEFKPSVRNLCVLMHDSFNRDLPGLKTEIEEALNLLEKETYIQRSGEFYEYLTDEEQDIEQEIKNTDIDSKAVESELEKLIYDGVLKMRKIRWDENGQDYAYTRKLDGEKSGREYELSINVITSFNEHANAEEKHRTDTVYNDELVVLLPESERLVHDLLMYKRTEKYIAHETRTTQRESIKRILSEKNSQNAERLSQLKTLVGKLAGQATYYVAGQELEFAGEDGQNKIVRAFYELIKQTYPNVRMLRGVQYNEAEIGEILRKGGQGLFANDTALPESEQEMLSFIQTNERGGVRTTVKSVAEKFERKPYGWSFAAMLCTLAHLCGRGKVEVRESTNLLDDSELTKALGNTALHGNLILTPQVEYTQSQIRAAKTFHNDFFEKMAHGSEAKALAKEIQQEFEALRIDLDKLQAQAASYPFVRMLAPVVEELGPLKNQPYNWFITEVASQEDHWFELKENIIDPVSKFMKGPQRQAYDNTKELLAQLKPNLSYIDEQKYQTAQETLLDPDIYKGDKVRRLKADIDHLQSEFEGRLVGEREQALATLSNMQKTLEAQPEYTALVGDQKQVIQEPFERERQKIEQAQLIAVVRDNVRRFEDEIYGGLLKQLIEWSQPAPPPSDPPSPDSGDAKAPTTGGTTEPKRKPTETIAASHIRVDYPKPWLATAGDVDDYIERYKEALLEVIKDGKNIQL